MSYDTNGDDYVSPYLRRPMRALEDVACPDCLGEGFHDVVLVCAPNLPEAETMWLREPCPTCNGSGRRK